jgi:hypothetical protein
VLRRAEAAGLWALPDESALGGEPSVAVDGWSLTVEVRDGARYRTYRYYMPRADAERPEERRAAAIGAVFLKVQALAGRRN